MPSNHPRCVQHGLVVATDNMCVLCRKEARSTSQRPEDARYNVPLTAAELTAGGPVGVLRVVGLLGSLMLSVSAAAYVLKMSPSRVPESQPTAANVELANTLPSEEISEIERAKATDLVVSLALQERAAVERRERQQLAAAEAEQRRVAEQAALAAHAQEAAAREPEVVTKSE